MAATASVGAMAAANANAGAQPSPGRTSRITQATPTIVTAVVPTASAVIGTAFSRVSLGAVRKAALYTSGGRNSTSTTSGDRSMFGHLRDQAGEHAEHDEHDRLGHLKPGRDRPPDDHHDGDGDRQREKLLLAHPSPFTKSG